MFASRSWRPKVACVGLLFLFAWICVSPPIASAQLGSLIVTVTSPSSGSTASNRVTIRASVTIIGVLTVTGVRFLVDGVQVGAEDAAAPYSTAWDTTAAPNGPHTLTAVARDLLGLEWTSDPVTVTVFNDTAPPAVSMTSPADGATVTGTITIRATASDDVGVAGVQFRLDGANLGREDLSAPYSVAWDTTASANGSHTLTAVARDAAGNTATAAAVTVTVGNDTTAPTVAIISPADGANVSGTVTVSGTASDNIGVAGVQFFLDGVALGREDLTAPYAVVWDTTTATDDSHTLTARARDAAGNTSFSAALTVTVFNGPPPSSAATRFEDTHPAITYTDGNIDVGRPPNWWHGSRSRDWSARTSSVNRSNGARATFTFTGTGVTWIGFRAPWAGIARVFVDGAFVSEVDLYAPVEQSQAPVFTASGLAAGAHTMTVESTGRKHGGDQCTGSDCAIDYAVFVDAFDVTGGTPPPVAGTRTEETAGSVSYTGAWTQDDRGKAWSGGTAATAAAAGARATFSFAGTSISWIGLRGPQTGIANVYLDGAFQAQIDTFYPTDVQAAIYSATDLAPARHTVTIESTGMRNAAATASLIAVDAFDVQSRIEDLEASIVVTGSWIKENTALNWSGTSANDGQGTAILSASAGDHAEFSFTGTSVSWIGFRSPLAGIAAVSVDGTSAGQIDLYSPTEAVRVPVFTATDLAEGTHTLRIDVTGQRNAAASAGYIVIDAFDVPVPASAPTITRLQEDDTSIAYSGSDWVRSNWFKFYSGEFAKATGTAGARATITFSGTGIRWISQRRVASELPIGVARVYLDGNLVAQVDERALVQEQDQAALFTATGLTPGTHTLAIEVVGRNGEAPGADVDPVVVDAFDVIR